MRVISTNDCIIISFVLLVSFVLSQSNHNDGNQRSFYHIFTHKNKLKYIHLDYIMIKTCSLTRFTRDIFVRTGLCEFKLELLLYEVCKCDTFETNILSEFGLVEPVNYY